MFKGFNLSLEKNDWFFGGDYEDYIRIGKEHLKSRKAKYEKNLEEYVANKKIDGTKIQEEWFPQIEADVFILHSHDDEGLACALAGWLYKKFDLKCFIDSNVWGYSKNLLINMNDELSGKRAFEYGDLYDYESCNQVSGHVNVMLSIALQKMIDEVEAVILLNTEQSVQVHDDKNMNSTYSPWIYTEIICTQIVRKKPLLVYREYSINDFSERPILENAQPAMEFFVSYKLSLRHLTELTASDLDDWKAVCEGKYYRYKLDALYDLKFHDEMNSMRSLFIKFGEKISDVLKNMYS